MGVASVAVLYFTVRRAFADRSGGVAAGLLAGVVLACTPAAAMMFRFNNPDALLVLLMTAAAYCVMRAVVAASWRWLALAGVVIGFAFLTKMLQAFLVLPGFALAYLLVASTTWPRRVLHLVGATAALVVAAGWWVLIVQLVPSTARPYVGGSTDNTVLELALGYNGLNRILGHNREGSNWSGDGSGLSAFSGRAGLHRLFTAEMANEIAWLLLVALFALAFGIYLAARRQLSRGELCALVIWGGWLVVTGVVLSFMSGVVHPYYTVSMAPSIAALIGMSGVWAWSRREGWDARLALGAMLALAAAPSAVLLHRNHFNVAWTVLVVAVAGVGVLGVLMTPRSNDGSRRRNRGTRRIGRYRNVFRHDHRDPAPRLDTNRDQDIVGARGLDGRRVGQYCACRPAGSHAHAMVGGDERFAVGGGTGNRLRHIGDGRRWVEW